MTVTVFDDRPVAGKRARMWPWAVAVAVAVAVAAGIVALVGVLGARWYSGLSLLQPYPAQGVSDSVPVGHTLYTDAALYAQPATPTRPASILLKVTAITPLVDSNTSNATLRVLVCKRNGTSGPIGTQPAGLFNSCSSVAPFTPPMTINLGFETAQVLVAVTPHRPGTIHIAGFDVTYSHTPRHTTQRTGAELTITTP